jgi:hypothetical protein
MAVPTVVPVWEASLLLLLLLRGQWGRCASGLGCSRGVSVSAVVAMWHASWSFPDTQRQCHRCRRVTRLRLCFCHSPLKGQGVGLKLEAVDPQRDSTGAVWGQRWRRNDLDHVRGEARVGADNSDVNRAVTGAAAGRVQKRRDRWERHASCRAPSHRSECVTNVDPLCDIQWRRGQDRADDGKANVERSRCCGTRCAPRSIGILLVDEHPVRESNR